jgi:hypothetical protein
MLPVQVRGPKGIVNIVAFIDDASNVTLLDSTVADMMINLKKYPLIYQRILMNIQHLR